MCLFWLVLKAALVNKKHRYILHYIPKEQKLGKKKSVLRCWAGQKGGGEKIPGKEGELWKQMSAGWQALCVGVTAARSRAVRFRAALASPTAVPRDLGWLLRGVAAGSPCSFFLVTCLPLGLCSPLCWLLQYSFSLLSQGFDAYVLKVATVTLGGSRW